MSGQSSGQDGGSAPRAPVGDGSAAAPLDEFAHIPRPRIRHPALALAAAGLAFFLVFQIRQDIRYALSPTAPLELGDARVAMAPGVQLDGFENRYVRVR